MSNEQHPRRAESVALAARWAAYARDVVGASAVVDSAPLGIDEGCALTVVRVTPHNPRAAAVSMMVDFAGMVLQVGSSGCRWELDDDAVDRRFVEDVLDAAIAGRVEELLGDTRSAVRFTLRDGSVETTTVTGALLPGAFIKRWLARGDWRSFEPFAGAAESARIAP